MREIYRLAGHQPPAIVHARSPFEAATIAGVAAAAWDCYDDPRDNMRWGYPQFYAASSKKIYSDLHYASSAESRLLVEGLFMAAVSKDTIRPAMVAAATDAAKAAHKSSHHAIHFDAAKGTPTLAAVRRATDGARPPKLRGGVKAGWDDGKWYSAPVVALSVDISGAVAAKNATAWHSLAEPHEMPPYEVESIEFFREVAQLPIDWSAWRPWRTLHDSAWSWLAHKKFAVIVDHPTSMLLDEQGRLHSDEGACATWADGSEMFMRHGEPVPAFVPQQALRIGAATAPHGPLLLSDSRMMQDPVRVHPKQVEVSR